MAGPALNGVVGRPARVCPDDVYSDAVKSSGLTWNEATLTAYLKNPQAKVPGARMAFPDRTSDEDIPNAIARLAQFGPDGRKR